MWARIVSIAVGVWLMVAPAVLDYGDPASASDRIAGPIAASLAAIAISEVTRSLRWATILPGAWLLLAPWVLSYDDRAAILNSVAAGVILIGCATVRGPVEDRFGGGWSVLWRSEPAVGIKEQDGNEPKRA